MDEARQPAVRRLDSTPNTRDDPDQAAQARKEETLRLLNQRIDDDRTAWMTGRPVMIERHVRAQRSASAASEDTDENVPLVDAAGIPEGDPLRRNQNREVR